MTDTMPSPAAAAAAETRWQTANSGRYMAQLCKHFAHRLRVTLNEQDEVIDFGSGRCLLQAGDEALAILIEAGSDEDLIRLQSVTLSHLQRFAFREMTEADIAAMVWAKA